MEKEKVKKDDEAQEKDAMKKSNFDFYKDDTVVKPFMSKTVEKNMMGYIMGKLKAGNSNQPKNVEKYF